MQKQGRMLGATTLAIGLVAAGLSLGAGAMPAKGPAASKSLVERGRYLATISGCGDCHTPGTLFGGPDFARALSGSEVGWKGPWGTSFARNLTPDPETGLGKWSTQDIIDALKTGVRKDGHVLLPPMPWPNTSQMADADLRALVAYLQSLPPVKHAVPEALPPNEPYSGPAITLPAPGAWDAPAPPAGR